MGAASSIESTGGKKVLVITSSPMGDASATVALCKAFCEAYRGANEGAGVDVIDCATLPPFTAARVQAKFSLYGGADTPNALDEWQTSKGLITKLCECDVLVIGAPMWNFGIPAPLKLWFDHVVQPNKTFDPATFAGLVQGKPCFIARATGGTPVGGEMDSGLVYLKHLLKFIGFSHVDVVGIAGQDPTVREAALGEATALGASFAFDPAKTIEAAPAWEAVPVPPPPQPHGSVIQPGAKVLYVSSSPMGGYSATTAVCESLVTTIESTVAEAKVAKLDLAAAAADGTLAPYTALRTQAKFTTYGTGALKTPEEQAEKLGAEVAAEWAVTTGFIAQLEEADVLIFGVPMWNFGIPFHLKAWLDHVIQPHHTFDPATYQGLLTGKKAFVVLAAGGPSLNGPMDRAIPYMKQALGFIGVSDITFIPINGTAGEGAADAKAAATDAATAAAGLKA